MSHLQRQRRQRRILHLATLPTNHLLRSRNRANTNSRRMDGDRSCEGDAPLPDPGRQPSRLQESHRRELHGCLRLPHISHRRLHRLRGINQEHPGRFQRK